MGLLNIGRQEGSQIIQLFGRGVRLRGKSMSLKRSVAIEGEHPRHVRLLETLNIFAVRANYMAQFRDYLEREGVETEGEIELPLFIWANEQFLKRGLVVPRPREGSDFTAETFLLLEPDPRVHVRVDMSLKVQAMESGASGIQIAALRAGHEQVIPPESLSLVDWETVFLDVLAYKERKGMANLIVRSETMRPIMERTPYVLVADEAVAKPVTFSERAMLQEAVTSIMRKYVDAFYRMRREQWDGRNLVYRPIDENDPNLAFNRPNVKEGKAAYSVKVSRSRNEVVRAIKKLIEDAEKLYKGENNNLPRIYFDRHLYLPLIFQKSDESPKATPPALKDSEAQFVLDLRKYWVEEKDRSLAGKEVFLLRNLSRGSGVGFFEERGFYPDFILWVMDGTAQRVVFIEPHGMIHAKAYIHDDKAQLHERLPELAQQIGQRSGRRDISLDSYIISATKYDDLRQRYDDGTWDRQRFGDKHILFLERTEEYDYMKRIFTDQIVRR